MNMCLFSSARVVGEALSYAFGGVPVTVDKILLSNFSGLGDEFKFLSPTVSAAAAPSGDVTMTPADAPPPTACAEAEEEGDAATVKTRTWILSKLLDEMIVHTRAEVRASITCPHAGGCAVG